MILVRDLSMSGFLQMVRKRHGGCDGTRTETVRGERSRLSGITGCTPAEYSNYEHERSEFPEKVYRKGMAYLEKRIAERRAESDSSTKK